MMEIYVLAHSLKRTAIRQGLSLIDLPRWVRQKEFAGLEVSDRQLVHLNPAQLKQLASECRSHSCQLIIDLNVDFTSDDSRRLQAEIGHAERLIATAAALEARRMRICLGGQKVTVQKFFQKKRDQPKQEPGKASVLKIQAENLIMRLGHIFRSSLPAPIAGSEKKIEQAVSALGRITPLLGRHNIRLGIENHWGISGDPRNIVRIVETVDSEYLGTCPDMGNFPRGIKALEALKIMAPRAVILHAKSYAFKRDGEEKSIDYRTILALFKQSGFGGPITVEFEGLGNDLQGCCQTRELILRHW